MPRKLDFLLPLLLGPLCAGLASAAPTRVVAQVSAPQQVVPPAPGAGGQPVDADTGGAAAAAARQQARLLAALRLPQLIEVMHDEGLDYGKQLSDQLFPTEGGEAWQQAVHRIYDPAKMRASFAARFSGLLTPAQRDEALAFLTSPLGRKVARLEVSARRALLDPDVEAAARDRVRKMVADQSPRLKKLRVFAEVNGLVEANVAGALNANYAFYSGLSQGHAPGLELSDRAILSDVTSQEDSVRRETKDWLFPFLATAYRPLSDAELDRYIAFSRSPAGKALNRALFSSFDAMFVSISHQLGLAAAGVLSGQNL